MYFSYIHIYIYVYIHTYIYAYIHIYKYTFFSVQVNILHINHTVCIHTLMTYKIQYTAYKPYYMYIHTYDIQNSIYCI